VTTVLQKRVAVPHALNVSHLTGEKVVQRHFGETMGTTWSVVALLPVCTSAETLRAAIARSFDPVVSQMSAWEPRSDLSRFNAASPGSTRALPAEFFAVLDYALSIAAETKGAYDPTVGALTALWGFGPGNNPKEVPDEEAIEIARGLCGWRQLGLSRRNKEAIQPGGMIIDLCAVAKGFAVDRLADGVRALGSSDFLVEIGGELRGEGCKPDGTPWWVAIEGPRAAHSKVTETVIALHGLAVATSGDKRRNFQCGGRWYAHTLDPRTGHPVQNGVVSVTVVADTCMEADALSTALYVLGEEDGLACASRRGIPALFVLEDGDLLRESLSPAFTAMTD
jgi:FAD:protein FMN transferase